MAYVQRFGVNRTSPVAISNNPATDIIDKHNGHFLIRGGNQVEFEESGYERTVVVEFNSFEDALNCYKSSEYQSALKFVKNSSKRYVSIVKGV